MAKKSSRPGRTLIVFLLAVGVLYGLAALGQTWKPRLGLDLEGGTRITLVAENPPTQTKLKQAAGIIDQRVNGSGVAEADVNTQGDRNIVVEIPGKNSQDLVDVVKRTAQLRFRLVAYCTDLTGSFCIASGQPAKASSSASPSTSPSPSGSTSPSPTSSSSGSTVGPDEATATPNPRPAPAYAVKADTTTPKPGKTKKATAKATKKATAKATKGATPAASDKPDPGAKVTDYKAWSKDPGTAWKLLFAVSRCDTTSHVALVPPVANTMSVSDPLSQQVLEKQLSDIKPTDLVPAADQADRPLIACNDEGNKFLLSAGVISGTQIKSASAGTEQQSLGSWIVQLSFKSSAKGTFADLSQALYDGASSPYAGGQFAVALDGQVVSYAGFNEPIPNGVAQISGGFTEKTAKSLAQSLKYGALPVKFKKDVSVQVIGPSLAGNQLSAGLFAGVIGLLIVMLYCLLYYRGLGTVVIASLVVAALVTYALVLILAKTAGFTLTLPGIAGLIVAVGITADSFIVYFERIRDEMRDGKSMRVAVQAGWVRARNTCLAADAVSFLAALVLYIFAIGVVRGFAFALGLSTLIDVAVFFWFTHPMMGLLSRRQFFNTGHRFSGLSRETLGMDAAPRAAGRSL